MNLYVCPTVSGYYAIATCDNHKVISLHEREEVAIEIAQEIARNFDDVLFLGNNLSDHLINDRPFTFRN